MLLIDMHVHSTFSDGTLSPEQIVSLAKTRGISVLALTDHDTTAGLPSFKKACDEANLASLAGIELSAEAPFVLHILGYRIDHDAARLKGRLEYVRDGRDARNRIMCEKLQALGIDVKYEEVIAAAGGEVAARPHIARLIMRKGYVNSISEAFSKYIGDGAPAYAERVMLSPEECISLITDAGGVAVLAHPQKCRLNFNALEALVMRLKDAGLWGIEAIYGSTPPDLTYNYIKLAEKFGLYTTAGSDFHGGNRAGTELGVPVSEDLLPWARLGVR